MRRDDLFGAAIGLFVVLPVVAAVGMGALVLVGQVIGWLRDGKWTRVPLHEAFAYFGLPIPTVDEWKGVQIIINHVLQSEVSLVAMLYFPVLVLCIVLALGNLLYRER